MAKILTKYTRPTELTQQQQGLITFAGGDSSNPYSFSDWLVRNTGLVPGQEKKQYDEYLKRWYTEHKAVQVALAQNIKNDYIQLLNQIALVFHDEAEQAWATDVNFDDPLEIEQVIPFYARKLKEIAIYLINKRDATRRSKLKYNTVGSRTALESLFYEYLLKAFTKRRFPGNEYLTNVSDVSVLNTLPELSAASALFQVTIEELYDDTSYFDKDPLLPATTYYDLCAVTVVDYLTGKGFQPSEFDWLYSTGMAHLCADSPLLWSLNNILAQYDNGLPLSAVESFDNILLNEYNKMALTEKYLGEQQYIISGLQSNDYFSGYYELWTRPINLPLLAGNNWFYWITGEFLFESNATQIFDPISINGSGLVDSGATAGSNYKIADIVFTQRNNEYKGAWLQLINNVTTTPTMCARIQEGKNIFAYPYPGYGVSGEDLPWTERQFDNVNYEFEYLDKSIQDEIRTLYWMTKTPTISALTPLYLYDTTLIDTGATPGRKYDTADNITVRPGVHDVDPNGIYTDQQRYAWLYRMEKTDIPLVTGTNFVYWPFIRYDNYIPVIASSAQCISMALSSINLKHFVGAIAGTNPGISDLIFKYFIPNELPTEGAWLYGPQPALSGFTGYSLVSTAEQPGTSFVVIGGSDATFIWSDVATKADNVFKHYNHQTDCRYLSAVPISLYWDRPSQKKELNYNQWQECDCRAIYYSPLGHPGSTFDEYGGMSDFIATISQPASTFDFTSWRGSDGKDYTQSSEFGWYRLSGSHVEPDVGWSPGKWITNTGASFILSASKMYMYFRSGLSRSSPSINVAPFVVRYPNSTQRQKWMRLSYDKNLETWVSDNVETTMTLKPGDYLAYVHRETQAITLTSLEISIANQTILVPPDFSNLTVAGSLSTMVEETNTIPVCSVFTTQCGGVISEQYASVSPLIYPAMGETSVDPMTAIMNVLNMSDFTTTSVVSSVTSYSIHYDVYTNNSTNYVLNVPLSGWNYSTAKWDGYSAGARPFWAYASDLPDANTKLKGIAVWGGAPVLVDGYNFITQPEFTDVVLQVDSHVEYYSQSPSTFIWIQPLEFTVSTITKEWKKLLFDTNAISNLSGLLANNITDLIISATNLSSDIVFSTDVNDPLLINYYARSPFTWSEILIDRTLGTPPTGGIWIPILSGDLVTPLTPYAYLTNRHYPTYATAPYTGNLYTVDDSGGYMIPRLLGVTTAVGKRYTTILDTIDILPQDPAERGMASVYQEPGTYTSDQGLTRTDQLAPVSTTFVDATWMKAGATSWYRAGMIENSRDHQEFIPYQTKYESQKTNDSGVRRQSDKYDPWMGTEDNTWANSTDWPPNFRKQYKIQQWYDQFFNMDKQIYQWKTDIFGNQYSLFKSMKDKSIYDKRRDLGEMWIRDARNIVRPGSDALSEIYSNFTALNTTISIDLSAKIRDFDIWYDTIMFYTTGYLLFAKINFDYTNNLIYAIADNIHRIPLCATVFGGTWFFEEDKSVTICLVNALSAGIYYPILYQLDLETNILEQAYNGSSSVLISSMSALSLTSIEDPVFTYSRDTGRYNVSFIGYSSVKEGMYVVSIDMSTYSKTYDIVNVTAIIPTS